MTEEVIEVLLTLPFGDAQMALLEDVSPRLHFTTLPARRPDDIPGEAWGRAEVLYTDRILPPVSQVARLRWIQFHFAGIDFVGDAPLLKRPNLVATTLSGAAAPQMAEYAMTMLLGIGHRLADLYANQQRAEWPRDRWERFRPLELRGATVGLVGYGSINRELARLLQPWGVTILATKRNVMHPADVDYIPNGLGDPEGNLFHRLYPYQALKSMLKLCDFVVVAVPLSAETRGLIGAEELAVLKPASYLVDFSRGGVIDQSALIQALQDHRLAGAALDVFPEEPLSPANPLWKMPNVLITPHIGGVSGLYMDRAAEMFAANLKRYVSGEALFNRYDPDRGY